MNFCRHWQHRLHKISGNLGKTEFQRYPSLQFRDVFREYLPDPINFINLVAQIEIQK